MRWHTDGGGSGSPGARLGSELEAAPTEAAADALIREFVTSDWHGSQNGAAAEGVDVDAAH